VPFGKYHYTDVLQPQMLNVPLLIPLAWLMMLPPSWAVATQIAGRYVDGRRFPLHHRLAVAGFSGLAITAWDLYLDPQMVAWGFWVWDQPGGYFGIPWINFFGWTLAGAIITLAASPHQVPLRPLLAVYTITWLLQAIGQGLFWSQPGPAFCGFLAMGGMLFWATRSPLEGRKLE
jgi:putative membrane protein